MPVPPCPVSQPAPATSRAPQDSATSDSTVRKHVHRTATGDRGGRRITEAGFFSSLLQRLSFGLASCSDVRRGQDGLGELLVAESPPGDASACTLPSSFFRNTDDDWLPVACGRPARAPPSKTPEGLLSQAGGEEDLSSSNESSAHEATNSPLSACEFLPRHCLCAQPFAVGTPACTVPFSSCLSRADFHSCLPPPTSPDTSSASFCEKAHFLNVPLSSRHPESHASSPPAASSLPHAVPVSDAVATEGRDCRHSTSSGLWLTPIPAESVSPKLSMSASTINAADGLRPTAASVCPHDTASSRPTEMHIPSNRLAPASGSAEEPAQSPGRWRAAEESGGLSEEATVSYIGRGSVHAYATFVQGRRPEPYTPDRDGIFSEEAEVFPPCSSSCGGIFSPQSSSEGGTSSTRSSRRRERGTEEGRTASDACCVGQTRADDGRQTFGVFKIAFDVYQGCRATHIDDNEVSLIGDPLFKERRPKVEDLVLISSRHT